MGADCDHLADDVPQYSTEPSDFQTHWSFKLWRNAFNRQKLNAWRPFLRRSYFDDEYAGARTACLAAARAILEDAARPLPQSFTRPWAHAFAQITACVILAYEYQRATLDAEQHDALRTEIEDHITRLETLASSPIVERGVSLLRDMMRPAPGAELFQELGDLPTDLFLNTGLSQLMDSFSTDFQTWDAYFSTV